MELKLKTWIFWDKLTNWIDPKFKMEWTDHLLHRTADI